MLAFMLFKPFLVSFQHSIPAETLLDTPIKQLRLKGTKGMDLKGKMSVMETDSEEETASEEETLSFSPVKRILSQTSKSK